MISSSLASLVLCLCVQSKGKTGEKFFLREGVFFLREGVKSICSEKCNKWGLAEEQMCQNEPE